MARKSKARGVLVARKSFVVGNRVVRQGETFREGHPLLRGRESLFEVQKVDNEHLEEAIAEPARKRAVSLRKEEKAEEAPEEESKADDEAAGAAEKEEG